MEFDATFSGEFPFPSLLYQPNQYFLDEPSTSHGVLGNGSSVSSSTNHILQAFANGNVLCNNDARQRWHPNESDGVPNGANCFMQSEITTNLGLFNLGEFGTYINAANRIEDENAGSEMMEDDDIQRKSSKRMMHVRRGSKPLKKENVIKGQWTHQEDRLLMQLVERHGTKKWSQIADMFHGRVGKQCRERWHNHLRPDIKKDSWSEEEDIILIEAHREIGNRWSEIARRLPGRTENTIKNHWNATKRRQHSRRTGKTKEENTLGPKNLLQTYIKTVVATSSSSSSSIHQRISMDKKPFLNYHMMGLHKTDGSGSVSVSSGTGGGDVEELKESMVEGFEETDSWMMMHGYEQIMRKEMDLLQMLSQGNMYT